MSPGGAGCSTGLLLTLGWLLLAGLQSTCGTNVTALQDPGLGHESESEGESEEEAEDDSEMAESEAPAEATEEDGERHRLLGGPLTTPVEGQAC